MKKIIKPKEKVDIARVASIMGREKFNKEIVREIQNGTDPNEAPDLIARRKLKGII